MTTPDDDRSVGYRKPPCEYTWIPGQSGNPRGRPKKRRAVSDDLRNALMACVTVVENGRKCRITAQAVIIRRIVRNAANGSVADARLLLSLIGRYELSGDETLDPKELDIADRAILDSYLRDVTTITGGPDGDAAAVKGQRDQTDDAGH